MVAPREVPREGDSPTGAPREVAPREVPRARWLPEGCPARGGSPRGARREVAPRGVPGARWLPAGRPARGGSPRGARREVAPRGVPGARWLPERCLTRGGSPRGAPREVIPREVHRERPLSERQPARGHPGAPPPRGDPSWRSPPAATIPALSGLEPERLREELVHERRPVRRLLVVRGPAVPTLDVLVVRHVLARSEHLRRELARVPRVDPVVPRRGREQHGRVVDRL